MRIVIDDPEIEVSADTMPPIDLSGMEIEVFDMIGEQTMAKVPSKPTIENPVEIIDRQTPPQTAQEPAAPEKPKLEPLTAEEREQLEDLERRAKNGRQILQPTPAEMVTLGNLRARAKANA